MVKNYYMVKPEFDNFRLNFTTTDRRCKCGFRTVSHTFIGGEIFSVDQYRNLISKQPKYCDFFQKIKRDSDLIINSFGIRESVADIITSEEKDSAQRLRTAMIARLVILIQKAEIHIAKSAPSDRSFILKYIKFFSNETLQINIDFYTKILKEKEWWKYEA